MVNECWLPLPVQQAAVAGISTTAKGVFPLSHLAHQAAALMPPRHVRSSHSLRSLRSPGTPPAGVADQDLQVGTYVVVLWGCWYLQRPF